MADDQEPTRQYHTPALPPEHQWQWSLLLYSKKGGTPLKISGHSKQEVYAVWDSLNADSHDHFISWEIVHTQVV